MKNYVFDKENHTMHLLTLFYFLIYYTLYLSNEIYKSLLVSHNDAYVLFIFKRAPSLIA